jgi:hypothetical protein
MLRKMFGPKRRGMKRRGIGKLRYEELRILYLSLILIRMIESRRMGWAGHAAPIRRRYIYIYIY